MASSTMATQLSFSSFSHRKSPRPAFSALCSSSSDNYSSIGFNGRTNPMQLKLDRSEAYANLSNGVIQAGKDNPPVMPGLMTPGGPMDLSTAVLFRNRTIFVGNAVYGNVAEKIISQLMTLASIDEEADIKMFINCPDGSVYSVLSIYDCMSWIKPRVSTICFGNSAGSATLLLAGGEKGMRFAMPNARIMMEQPRLSVGGEITDLRREVAEAVRIRQKVDKMYAAFTGRPLELMQSYTDRFTFMTPIEALDLGLIDGILPTRE